MTREKLDRLRRLAEAGAVEKDSVGRWRPKGEEARPTELKTAAPEAPWIKPLSSYEQRETTVVEGLRYG